MKKSFLLLLAVAFCLSCLCACAGGKGDAPKITMNGAALDTLTLFEGQTAQLTCDVDGAVWSSSDSAVATVERDGYVRAKGQGAATVAAEANGKKATVEVTVTEYVAVTEVIARESYTVRAGFRRTLNITTEPQNASDVTLTFRVTPEDGKITFADGKVYASADATPGAEYAVSAVNERSGKEATFTLKISAETQPVAWTIADSIFDFNDVSDDDMVQTILKNAGYNKWFMDNIAGRTVKAASGVGIVDYIDKGFYDDWPDPELVLIHCGSNDSYYMYTQPEIFTKENVKAAVEYVCNFLHERCPDARVVWTTSIWRRDGSAEYMDYFSDCLFEICPRYGMEVLDMRHSDYFKDLTMENYGTVLYDGIHPSQLGKSYYVIEYGKFLSGEGK